MGLKQLTKGSFALSIQNVICLNFYKVILTYYVLCCVICRMNFFKRKRDPNDREQIDAERGRDTKRPRNIVSLIKKAGDSVKQKITVAFKALTTRTYRHDVKSFLFTTPAGPLRSARYIMTPSQPFSAAKSSLEWR